jgi:hypothetical protein
MNGLHLVTALLASWFSQAQIETPDKQVRDLLPKGEMNADVMVVELSARYKELSGKLKQAIARNHEWYTEYLKSSGAVRPLPYHPNLGLTKEEYDEMESLASGGGLRKTQTVKLTINIQPDGSIGFSPEPALAALADVRIDASWNAVQTPYGKTTLLSAVHTPSGGLFSWDGVEWSGGRVDRATLKGLVVKVFLGKVRESGKTFLGYTVTDNSQPGKPLVINWMLMLSPVSKGSTAAPEEPLSDDELDRKFIQARLTTAIELSRKGALANAIEVLEDVIKTYPRHVLTKDAVKLLETLRNLK